MKFFDVKVDENDEQTSEDKNTNNQIENDSDYHVSNGLDVNSKNSSEFQQLMENASTNYDSYWDKNNPLVKAIMIILLLIIVVGAAYYIISWCLFN